jgi:hypothetical protein
MSIKYVFLGNSQTGKDIGCYPAKPKDQWVSDGQKIFERYCKSNAAKHEQRNLVVGTDGNLCFIIMPSNIFYLVLSDVNCAERDVFHLIDEIHRDSIYLLTDEKGELNKIGKTSLKTLVEEHMKKTSSLKNVSNEVDDIKIEMKAAIAKTVNNVENVQHLEQKAVKIKDSSNTFKKNSNELKKITCRQNCKWTIILLLLIIGVLLIIIVPIAVSASKGDSNSNTSTGVSTTTTVPSSTTTNGTIVNGPVAGSTITTGTGTNNP